MGNGKLLQKGLKTQQFKPPFQRFSQNPEIQPHHSHHFPNSQTLPFPQKNTSWDLLHQQILKNKKYLRKATLPTGILLIFYLLFISCKPIFLSIALWISPATNGRNAQGSTTNQSLKPRAYVLNSGSRNGT